MNASMTVAELVSAVSVMPKLPYDPRLGPEISRGTYDWECGAWWPNLIAVLSPLCVVELGTGAGRAAALMMTSLSNAGILTTIDLPDLDNFRFGHELDPWCGDPRLTRLVGDTTSERTARRVWNEIDLLVMDTLHTEAQLQREWELFAPKLADGAIVVVDDLDQNDARRFWEQMWWYDRMLVGNQGVFRLKRVIQ